MTGMIYSLLFGFLLLFAGRNLFWLCVGMVGFLLGVQCAPLLGLTDGAMALIAALALGILGVILAVCFEWAAVVFGAGLLGGGYLLMSLFPSAAVQGVYAWPIFVIGGILGMCLMIIAFDLTLIVVSSLLGAVLVVNAFQGTPEFRDVLFIISAVSGVLVQYTASKGLEGQRTSRQQEA